MPVEELSRGFCEAVRTGFGFSMPGGVLAGMRIANDVIDIVDVLELAGITRRTCTTDPGPPPLLRREGGDVELTSAGMVTVRRLLTDEGYDTPAAGRFAGATAAELLKGTDPGDFATLSAEVEAWQRRRSPEEAAAQLADAVRTLDDFALKHLALAAMADLGVDVAEPFVRELAAGSAARGLARYWLVERDLEDVRILFDPSDPDAFADVLACRMIESAADETSADDGLSRTLALAGDQAQQIDVIGKLWRCQSTAAGGVLETIGGSHPVKPVSKAARKALFRWRSRHAAPAVRHK
jgi:hypothetical protein